MSVFRSLLSLSSVMRQQEAELVNEEISLCQHLTEARRLTADIPQDFRLLIIDISEGKPSRHDFSRVLDDSVVDELQHRQYGGDRSFDHGHMFRHLMGFDIEDSRVRIWRFVENCHLELPDCDAWVMTGGPTMISQQNTDPNGNFLLDWLRCAQKIIKKLFQRQVPGLAVCLGHQLIAHEFGSSIGPVNSSVREFGISTLKISDLELRRGWDGSINASHVESVLTAPTGSECFAHNKYNQYQGLSYKFDNGGRVLTLQNHPEILASTLLAAAHLRCHDLEREGFDVSNMLFRDTPGARRLLMNFLSAID